jgi:hypothetical protein
VLVAIAVRTLTSAGERVRHSRVGLADPSDLRAAGLDLPAAELRERPGRRLFSWSPGHERAGPSARGSSVPRTTVCSR